MYIDSIMLRNKQVPKDYAVEALKECKKVKQELIIESRDIKDPYARRNIQKRIAYYADMYRLITDYISSSIMVSFVPTHSSVEVYIWPQELKGMIPDFLRDYLSFVTFCNKALQEYK